jgi:hypothetical protein
LNNSQENFLNLLFDKSSLKSDNPPNFFFYKLIEDISIQNMLFKNNIFLVNNFDSLFPQSDIYNFDNMASLRGKKNFFLLLFLCVLVLEDVCV